MALVYLSQKHSVSKVICGASANPQLLLQAILGMMVFVVSLPFWRKMDLVVGSHVLSAFFSASSVLVHRALVNRGLNLVSRATGQARVELGWGYGYLLGQLNLSEVFWQLDGVAPYSGIEPICSSSLS